MGVISVVQYLLAKGAFREKFGLEANSSINNAREIVVRALLFPNKSLKLTRVAVWHSQLLLIPSDIV